MAEQPRILERAVVHAELMAAFHHRFGIIPDYEKILECTYSRLIGPGATVIDIGAHSGRHTAVFAELAGPTGRVHAFEPLPMAMASLRARGLGPHVTLHACAIANRRGLESFIFARGAPEESGLRLKVYNQPDLVTPETIEVMVCPLDDFIDDFDGLQFIKIDAEGAEIGCLESARHTIARHRPIISVEYGYPGYSAFDLHQSSLFDIASSLGYVVGDLFGAVCSDRSMWARVCDAAYWDWYLVPAERVTGWQAALGV